MRILQVQRRFPGHPRATWIVLLWSVVRQFVLVVFKVVYGVRLVGARRVPRHGPLVYVVNHQSHFDPVLVGLLVWDRPFASMARSGLFTFKPFGLLITLLGAIPLRQGRADKSAFRASLRELNEGRALLIFAEGSRTLDGHMQRFQPGVLALLRRSEAVPVPIAVDGVFDAWPRGRRYPRLRGRMGALAGEPMDREQLLAMKPEDALEHMRRTVEQLRLELRADLRRCSRGRWPRTTSGDRPYWEAAR